MGDSILVDDGGDAVNVAVIGCGAIAQQHLQYLSNSKLVNLQAVCDSSPVAAAYARRRFGAHHEFVDVRDMLRSADFDVVHVLTPPNTHVELVRQCVEAGSDVICEKPLTDSARATLDLLEHAHRRGRIVVESRNLLWNDAVQRIDHHVGIGSLGDVREVDVMLSLDLTKGPFGDLNLTGPGVRLPGGAIHDFLPHLAYLFLHFIGDPDHVDSCIGDLWNASGNARVGFDQLDALVSSGTRRGRLRIASDLAPDSFRLFVRGTKGSIETDLYNPYFRVEGGVNVGKRAPFEQMVFGLRMSTAGIVNLRDKVVQHGTYHGMARMLESFYSAAKDRRDEVLSPVRLVSTAHLVDRLVRLSDRSS